MRVGLLGLGRALYEQFFDATKKLGCNVFRCVTSPVNKGSVSFHLRMGFYIELGSKNVAILFRWLKTSTEGAKTVFFFTKHWTHKP